MQVELKAVDVRLIVQSLEHCLATCKNHSGGRDAPCEDCDRARELRERLKTLKEV